MAKNARLHHELQLAGTIVQHKKRWEFPPLSRKPRLQRVDIDGDGKVEIIFGGSDGRFDAFTIDDAKNLRSQIVFNFQKTASEWDAPIEEQQKLFSLLQEKERKPFGFMEVSEFLQLDAALKPEDVFKNFAQVLQRIPEFYSKYAAVGYKYLDDKGIEERIEKISKAMNFQFPASYMSFMRRFGGGCFSKTIPVGGVEQRLVLYPGPLLQGNSRPEAMARYFRMLGTENTILIGNERFGMIPIVFLRGCPTTGDEYAIGTYSDFDFRVDILAYTFPELIQSVLSKLSAVKF